ncbi:MAG: patatin-like phospholipase family protein [Actinomycetota bacterium]
MRAGLILGGGGLVGMGYHAGALKALEEAGLHPGSADVIVGTSAGAVMGAYLRVGWTPTDFYDYGMGRHPRSPSDPDGQRAEVRDVFTPLWSTRGERARRWMGSMFAVAAARGYWRAGGSGRLPHPRLRRLFPSGMYSTERTRQRLREDLPGEWPRDDLFLCVADLYSGRRVAFGTPEAPTATLPDAVMASTAIPGVFPPVRIGPRYYVDGGVLSATSLDLAVDAGCKTALCIAPLGFREDGPPMIRDPAMWGPVAVRTLFARALRREVRAARERSVEVLVIRPWLTELKAHGTNSMRHFDRVAVIDAAREGTRRLLEEHADHPAITALTTRKEPERWPRHSTA